MPTPTTTKAKTTTKIGLAVVFLAIAAVLAIGTQRFSNRQTLQRAAQMVQQATPTFCLSEISFLPNSKEDRSLTQALFSTPAAEASSHTTSQTVEVRTPTGSTCPAVVELRNRGEVEDTISLPSGRGTITRTVGPFPSFHVRCTSGAYNGFTGWGGVILEGTRVIVAGNDPDIEDGTVVVEFVDEMGRRTPVREVEVKRGSQVFALFDTLTGEEHVGLDPGSYEVNAIRVDSRFRGTGAVEARRGAITRYIIRLTTPIPLTATVPPPEPLRAELPGERDCGNGTVRVIAGNICDRDNRILPNASGIIAVSQNRQRVCHTYAVNGAFEIYDRPNGTYTIQFQNPGLGVFEREVVLDIKPQRVNFRMR